MKKLDTTQLVKTSEMLDETLYWDIIDNSLKNTRDQDEQLQFLAREISKLTLTQIIGFKLQTDRLLFDTYTSSMWCAAYIMNGGCSDDGFEYFRNWVISRGKDAYYKAKKDPDSLAEQINENTDSYEFEDFWYLAPEVFTQKTGKDLDDYIDYDRFRASERHYPEIEFTWEEEDPDSMKKICPRLFRHFAAG